MRRRRWWWWWWWFLGVAGRRRWRRRFLGIVAGRKGRTVAFFVADVVGGGGCGRRMTRRSWGIGSCLHHRIRKERRGDNNGF